MQQVYGNLQNKGYIFGSSEISSEMKFALVLFAAFVLTSAQEPQPCGKHIIQGVVRCFTQTFPLAFCRIT